MKFDIKDLINKRRIEGLSLDYNVVFLEKVNEQFDSFSKDLFITSFYSYLNHDEGEFVVDFDDVWDWIGYASKQKGMRLLKSHFVENNDYKFCENNQPKNGSHGGHNIQKVFLTINAFKGFCLLSGTEKARNVHKYYINLERIMHETITEEATELRQKLLDTSSQKDKEVEAALVSQFHVNSECIYFGTINNTNDENEKLIKFGHTNDLENRVWCHHKDYNNFRLKAAFKVQNKVEIENAIKSHPKVMKQLRVIQINNRNKTEILAYDESKFTIQTLKNIIKQIVKEKAFNEDNFNRLVSRNNILEKENSKLKENIENLQDEINSLRSKIKHQAEEEKLHIEKNLDLEKTIQNVKEQKEYAYEKSTLCDDEELVQKFNEFVDKECIVHPNVSENSVNLEGRYRLWRQVKPTKKVFHALKHYLDTRFRPKRIDGIHGYVGIKLRSMDYQKQVEVSRIQDFIFEKCEFSDTARVLNSHLLQEYQEWKQYHDYETHANDIKDIKSYLNSCPYALKATVWSHGHTNEGYYGLTLKSSSFKPHATQFTGKKVLKVCASSKEVVCSWDSVAEAARAQCFSTSKMSRLVKSKNVIDDYYFTSE